jgi:hypothetical protein
MESILRWRRRNGSPSWGVSMPERARAARRAHAARVESGWDGPVGREPSVDELEALGLGVTIRPYLDRSNVKVLRVYCLACGIQIDASQNGAADDWLCPQGCNDPKPGRRSTDS